MKPSKIILKDNTKLSKTELDSRMYSLKGKSLGDLTSEEKDLLLIILLKIQNLLGLNDKIK